jgi:hypothetical protein
MENADHVLQKLESIEKRLFHDNGRISIQTRLDRHEQVIRGMLWALSVIGGALIASTIALTVYILKVLIARGGV